MKIYIATDHRGVDIEDKIVSYLKDMEIDVVRTNIKHTSTDDYPDFAFDVAKNVLKDEGSLGILICGTGIGMSIAANKVKGIRAARCVSVDDAFYAKNHNAANVICLGMNNSYEEMIRSVIEDHQNERVFYSDSDEIRKYERMVTLESTFAAYPPFWYHYGSTANHIARNPWLPLSEEARKGYREDAVSHFETY